VRPVGLDESDVVIMDVQLPDGTGVAACREIPSRRPEVQVPILTSFAGEQVLHTAIRPAPGRNTTTAERRRKGELAHRCRWPGRVERPYPAERL